MNTDNKLIKPIFFIGSGRTGTTIISEIVFRHPELAYPSNYQNKFFKYSSINLIRLLFDNKMWRIIGQQKQLNKVNIFNKYIFTPIESYRIWNYLLGEDMNFSRDFLIDKKISADKKKEVQSYFYKMVKYQNKKRLAVKITGPSRIAFVLSIFPDAQFVYLKRSLIPTISSFLKIPFWKERGFDKLWWTGAYTDTEKEWVKKNRKNPILLTTFQIKKLEDITKMELKKFHPSFIEVRYEDFVSNPKMVITSIIEFLGLEKKSVEIYKYLENINVLNRNKADSEYFSKNELKEINKILKGSISDKTGTYN